MIIITITVFTLFGMMVFETGGLAAAIWYTLFGALGLVWLAALIIKDKLR